MPTLNIEFVIVVTLTVRVIGRATSATDEVPVA